VDVQVERPSESRSRPRSAVRPPPCTAGTFASRRIRRG
jgi:hypothetical protein